MKGSHYYYCDPITEKIVAVPFHKKDLRKGTLQAILPDAEISIEELTSLLCLLYYRIRRSGRQWEVSLRCSQGRVRQDLVERSGWCAGIEWV